MPGATIGPYRLESELGSGGMGSVHLGTAQGEGAVVPAGSRVAVKLVHPHLLDAPGALARFLREAEIGARVRDPNVVATLDVGAVPLDGRSQPYLVMEYVEGQTLADLLAELGRVPEELCRHLGREIARGLAAIHAAGAVHRDLKPQNVMVTRDHAVKVMDLGVARLSEEATRLSGTNAFVGSIRYAAPEQFRPDPARPPDGRADLWALGVVLYELATGAHPAGADDVASVVTAVLHGTPRRPAELNPQLSPFFEELVLALLAKDPGARPGSAAEVARILADGEDSDWWRERARALRAATRRPLRRIRIPRETALHGRDAEIARLASLFDAAAAGDGRVALVEGEAGIGKTRLVDEFAGRLTDGGRDVNFLHGAFVPGGAAASAIVAALRDHFEGGPLEESLAALLPQTPLLVPAFAALLRGDAPPPGAEPLTSESVRTVSVHLLRALAAERPTLLLVDDLQFASDDGRALFAALALAVPGHRLLVVGASRPDLPEAWLAEMRGAERIALARLSAKNLVALLADSLRSQHLAEELAGRIALKSDGNPFFVFEILRGLRDGRFLARRDDGTWVSTRMIGEIEIPSSVMELVQARIADLDEEDRNILDVASCLGFDFDPLLVGAVLGIAQIPLMRRLAHVEKRHRLVRSAGRRFLFDHHQVQEALYAGMPLLLREPYHAAIAAAIEARAAGPGDPPGETCVDLARHLLLGAEGPRALRWLAPALAHLSRCYRGDDALRLAQRALDQPGLLEGAERARVLLATAVQHEAAGRSDDELAALTAALDIVDDGVDGGVEGGADAGAALRARVLCAIGGLLYRISRPDEATAALREAVGLAEKCGDASTRGAAELVLGSMALTLGRTDEARERFAECVRIAVAVGDASAEAHARENLGSLAWTLGRHDEARERFAENVAWAERAGDRRLAANATGSLGLVCCALGRYAEAAAHLERSLEMSREIGNRRGETISTGNLGGVLRLCGRLGEALACAERHLALAREIGYRRGEAIAAGSRGLLLRSLGRLDAARADFETYLAISREIGDLPGQANALGGLAAVAAAHGDRSRALECYDEVLGVVRRTRNRRAEAETLAAMGGLCADEGRTDDARRLLGEAADLARATGERAAEVTAAAERARLDPAAVGPAEALLREHEPRLAAETALHAHWRLWQAGAGDAHRDTARRILDGIVAHAPEEFRRSAIRDVPLHREIADAVAPTVA